MSPSTVRLMHSAHWDGTMQVVTFAFRSSCQVPFSMRASISAWTALGNCSLYGEAMPSSQEEPALAIISVPLMNFESQMTWQTRSGPKMRHQQEIISTTTQHFFIIHHLPKTEYIFSHSDVIFSHLISLCQNLPHSFSHSRETLHHHFNSKADTTNQPKIQAARTKIIKIDHGECDRCC